MAAPSSNREQHGGSTKEAPAVSTEGTVSLGEADVAIIPAEARQLLEEYSGIPPDQVLKHVTDVVNIAP